MTTIEDVMNYAREAGNMERRMCIGKAQGFDVRNAYNELRAAIEQYAAERVAQMQAEFDQTCLDLQDYADRMTAERDALTRWKSTNAPRLVAIQGLLDKYQKDAADGFEAITSLQSEREANTILTNERDALQEDADRYRWLRDMDEDPVCSLAAMWTDCKGSAHSISKRVDAAVDAARGKNTT